MFHHILFQSICLSYMIHLRTHSDSSPLVSPYPVMLHFLFFLISFFFYNHRYSFARFFFFNDTAPPEIYPLPLHDALPICAVPPRRRGSRCGGHDARLRCRVGHDDRDDGLHVLTAVARDAAGRSATAATVSITVADRKSTRLNSSHLVISYAVFCLKKKKRQ